VILIVISQDHNALITVEANPNPVEGEATNAALAELSNGGHIPLVGFGVGNLEHDMIDSVIASNIQPGNNRHYLIDTARASQNEHIIAKSIAKQLSTGSSVRGRKNDADTIAPPIVHVVTKIWYTHLGYKRTRLSIMESLKDLSMDSASDMTNIRVHILLHWPRCNDSISWMKCEEEEENLPKYVKNAGPPPHLDKSNAWKESWRALEDAYLEQKDQELNGHHQLPIIESIGISNFERNDLEELMTLSRIKPELFQGNVWLVIHDRHLMNLLQEHDITFQAYNIMNALFQQRSHTPNAYSVLTTIGENLAKQIEENDPSTSKTTVTEGMVIMAWLVQSGFSVIPRASSSNHQLQNSPASIHAIPGLTGEQSKSVKNAMSALMTGKDVKLKATFHNALDHNSNIALKIHWSDNTTGEEFTVIERLLPGDSSTIHVHPGHTFVAYADTDDEEKKSRKEFTITASYGGRERFSVDEL